MTLPRLPLLLPLFLLCLAAATPLSARGDDDPQAIVGDEITDPAMAELEKRLKPIEVPEDRPELPAETAALFEAMRVGAAASADVFRPMTAEQLNFKPANGSHTPRWNVEHNAGTQLKFFSEIYHAIDGNIPVIDLMPKQMPADYQPAHPTWDGKLEAARILAVDDFCRRYAYLIADVDLDAKPPATFWPSYRALLKKMPAHMTEHTDNVKKKMMLPDWP